MEENELEFERYYKVKFMEVNKIEGMCYIEDPNFCTISIPDEKGLVVREDELDFYKTYGGGFKSIKYVGSRPKILSPTFTYHNTY